MIFKHEINEGWFFSDKATMKKYSNEEESKQQFKARIDKLVDQLQDDGYEPKVNGGIQLKAPGKYFAEITYNKKDKDNDKSVMGMVGNKIVDKTKQVVKDIANDAKDTVVKKATDLKDKHLPKGNVSATSQRKLKIAKQQLLIKRPDAKFTDADYQRDGMWYANWYAKSQPKPTASNDIINNIQRQLSRLSDDKLKKIDAIIKA
jgi:hypothetical protein